MSSSKFSDEFKRDAVAQITERGYPVREVSERLGVSPYSGAARPMRTSLRKGRTTAPYAAQRPRHSVRAAARFALKWTREVRLRS